MKANMMKCLNGTDVSQAVKLQMYIKYSLKYVAYGMLLPTAELYNLTVMFNVI